MNLPQELWRRNKHRENSGSLIPLVILWAIIGVILYWLVEMLCNAGIIPESWLKVFRGWNWLISIIVIFLGVCFIVWREDRQETKLKIKAKCYGLGRTHHFDQGENRCSNCKATKKEVAREIKKLKKEGKIHTHHPVTVLPLERTGVMGRWKSYCNACGATYSEMVEQEEAYFRGKFRGMRQNGRGEWEIPKCSCGKIYNIHIDQLERTIILDSGPKKQWQCECGKWVNLDECEWVSVNGDKST